MTDRISVCAICHSRQKSEGVRIAQLKAENAKLKEAAKGAYFEGWGDGRNTTSVTGDPTVEWNESEALAALLEDK